MINCRLQDHISAEDAARFDLFVGTGPHASYMQKTTWVRLAPVTRLHRYMFLQCEEMGQLRVAGLTRLTRLFPGRYMAVFPRGPVFHEIEHFESALPPILDSLRKAGVCTVLMSPRWEDDGARKVEDLLEAHKMRKLGRSAQSMHSTTGHVSLRDTEENIFEGFEKRCRKDIRRATRKGLIIRQATTEEEANQLRDLRREMAAQKNLDDSGLPDLLDQWHSFQKDEEGVFLLAEAEDQLIGGLVVVREGERAVIRGGGTLPILSKIPRTHNLIWESMRVMKKTGCTIFDLAGMPDDEEIEDDERRRQVFKLAFNPRIVKLVPTYFAVLRPFDHALFFSARQWYRRSSIRRFIGPLLRRK